MSDPWYRRFPDNFLGGINGMTLEEKGAYSVVIDMIYQRGGPIADEPRYIAGICNCSVRKWNAIRARLIELGKIHVVNGHLMNERAAIELEKTAKNARELAENGAKGGNKKAENIATLKENKGLGVAPALAIARGSTSTPFKKEAREIASPPTEGAVWLDRWSDEALFKACETVRGKKTAEFMQKDVFNAATVAKARALLSVGAPEADSEAA